MTRLTALMVTVAAGLSLVACSSGESAAAPPMSATVQQYREDEVAGNMQVQLTNHGTDVVTVREVQLVWSGITSPAPVDKNYPLTPGLSTDLAVPVGVSVCATTDPPPFNTAVARVRIEGAGTVDVPITDSDSVLGRMWRRDCVRQRVAAAVDVTFGRTWTSSTVNGIPAARGTLEVRRKAATGPLAMTDMRGTVLFALQPAPGTTLPVSVAATEPQLTVPVDVFTSGRCDGHSLGEAKKPFDFTITLTAGSETLVAWPVRPDPADQSSLRDVLESGCAVVTAAAS